jgi:hydrogenase/urease accessory protein HupE
MKLLLRLMLLIALVAASAFSVLPASAHELTMAEMEVRETAPGEFLWQWSAQNDKRPMGDELKPRWPDTCQTAPNRVSCGQGGLKGPLTIEGVGKQYSAAIIKVYWLDGQTRAYTLTKVRPTAQLYGSAEDQRGRGEIAWAYLGLGVEHILSGVDHLLFVASLLFLVGFRRRLIGTVTAFTLAHSLTLASSALGLLTLRPPPVEATIAMSIVLVASEALRDSQSLARRLPALVSFLFGLVHGLGFAGALKDIGLPKSHVPLALLTFNLGVELGQLLAVVMAYGIVSLPISRRRLGRARKPALYAIGVVAAYWSWLRIAAIVV